MTGEYRPDALDNYIGQDAIRQNLAVMLAAARIKQAPVESILVSGPAGCGKTTIGRIVAHEMGTKLHSVIGGAMRSMTDLVAILRQVGEGHVLFIDEGHALTRLVEEGLGTAMEEHRIDIVAGESVKMELSIPLPRFTVVLATTRMDLITKPLLDRFGAVFNVKLYTPVELTHILNQANLVYQINATSDGLSEIAKRGRGTPRVALKYLRRAGDYALTVNKPLDKAVADAALKALGVDALGLTELDKEYLETLITRFNGGPAGLDAIANSMPNAANADEIAGYVEPYLSKDGFIERGPRGRTATARAYKHLGIALPEVQTGLIGR